MPDEIVRRVTIDGIADLGSRIDLLLHSDDGPPRMVCFTAEAAEHLIAVLIAALQKALHIQNTGLDAPAEIGSRPPRLTFRIQRMAAWPPLADGTCVFEMVITGDIKLCFQVPAEDLEGLCRDWAAHRPRP